MKTQIDFGGEIGGGMAILSTNWIFGLEVNSILFKANQYITRQGK